MALISSRKTWRSSETYFNIYFYLFYYLITFNVSAEAGALDGLVAGVRQQDALEIIYLFVY